MSQTALEKFLLTSIELVKEAILRANSKLTQKSRPLIAASLGPYGAYLADGSEYHGKYNISVGDLKVFHKERVEILENSEADLLAFETIPNIKEAEIISQILRNTNKPSWVSFSCRNDRELNDGSKIESAIKLFTEHPLVFALGINCTKPKYISILIERIKSCNKDKKIIVYPNSGEAYHAKEKSWVGTANPNSFVQMTKEWMELGADIVGGCCRIGPEHILKIKQQLLNPSESRF